MIVIAIVGILSVVWTWGYTGYTERARDLVRKTALQNIAQAIEVHYRENYSLPIPTSSTDNNTYSDTTSPTGQALEHISGNNALWYKGTFGTLTYQNIKNTLTQHYTDPKTGIAYAYFIDKNKMYYYLEAQMELQVYKSGVDGNYRTENGIQYYYLTNYQSIWSTSNTTPPENEITTPPSTTPQNPPPQNPPPTTTPTTSTATWPAPCRIASGDTGTKASADAPCIITSCASPTQHIELQNDVPTCVDNTKQALCIESGKPTNNAYYTTPLPFHTINWDTTTKTWSTPPLCEWKCAPDYEKQGNECVKKSSGIFLWEPQHLDINGNPQCIRDIPGRFIVSENVITDTKTSLMWSKQTSQGDWETAKSYCHSFSILKDGEIIDDWRLPDITELRSIVNYNCFDRAMFSEFSFAPSMTYWTSNVSISSSNYIRAISLKSWLDGSQSRSSAFYVLCVR